MAGSSGRPIRIVLVDDYPIVRAGLTSFVSANPEIEVVGEAGSVAEAIEVVGELKPDVVLLEHNLGGESGLAIPKWIFENGYSSRCIVLTSLPSDRALLSGFDSGAVMAFMAKTSTRDEIVEAVFEVAGGRSLLNSFHVREASQRLDDCGLNRLETLSRRELEVAELVAAGLSDAQIAATCFVSVSTVRHALQSAYTKLLCDSRTQLGRLVWQSEQEADAS